MAERRLAEILDQAIRSMWPKRLHRELLLDLGERKGWTDDDHSAAIGVAAAWLHGELGLPETLICAPVREPVSVHDVRELGAALQDVLGSEGVARWARAIAPSAGSTAKTLANTMRAGLDSGRPDHRWLRLIVRSRREPLALDAYAYHRRSPLSVATVLAGIGGGDEPDAADATLVMSLLALWQRRRQTSEVRGNRGKALRRRVTPKPVAAVRDTLIVLGQLGRVGRLAAKDFGVGSSALVLLGAEAALTEAHLAPHLPRASSAPSVSTGEGWLRAVEALLEEHGGKLGGDDRAALRFRIDRMRAWRDGTPQPVANRGALALDYVRATLELEEARAGAAPRSVFSASAPGVMMVLPLLRRRGFEVTA